MTTEAQELPGGEAFAARWAAVRHSYEATADGPTPRPVLVTAVALLLGCGRDEALEVAAAALCDPGMISPDEDERWRAFAAAVGVQLAARLEAARTQGGEWQIMETSTRGHPIGWEPFAGVHDPSMPPDQRTTVLWRRRVQP